MALLWLATKSRLAGRDTCVRPIETRYALSGDVRIAYQVVGQGSFDLVFVPGFISNLDLHWEDQGYSRLLRRLSAFSRLILFDKRGTGLSDRVDTHNLPSLETRMDDVRAVMDATGSGRAALLGASEGAGLYPGMRLPGRHEGVRRRDARAQGRADRAADRCASLGRVDQPRLGPQIMKENQHVQRQMADRRQVRA